MTFMISIGSEELLEFNDAYVCICVRDLPPVKGTPQLSWLFVVGYRYRCDSRRFLIKDLYFEWVSICVYIQLDIAESPAL
jgi:hypothetical protein